MCHNACELFCTYNRISFEKGTIYYLWKIAMYARKDLKIEYIFLATEYEKTRNLRNELVSFIDILK
jgi:hypothetical protein